MNENFNYDLFKDSLINVFIVLYGAIIEARLNGRRRKAR